MFRHTQIYISNSITPQGMMIRIVGIMTSFMKGQGIYTKFKVKYSKKETLHSIILQEEETSTLVVDSEEEDEEEVWVKVKDRSLCYNCM
jgi:hypothetical protein